MILIMMIIIRDVSDVKSLTRQSCMCMCANWHRIEPVFILAGVVALHYYTQSIAQSFIRSLARSLCGPVASFSLSFNVVVAVVVVAFVVDVADALNCSEHALLCCREWQQPSERQCESAPSSDA